MSDIKYKFYDHYDPASNVAKSLNEEEEDYDLAAPYRDLLGILESEEIWEEEKAITASEIRNKLIEWDDKKRIRSTTPPKDTKIIRERLDDLYQKYLVLKITKPGRSNRYWKVPDNDIHHPYARKAVRSLTRSTEYIDIILYQHELVKISIFVYIVGSLLALVHQFGVSVMIVAATMFVVGHVMEYFGIPFFK